jgi:hypothetical protein
MVVIIEEANLRKVGLTDLGPTHFHNETCLQALSLMVS